MTGEISVTPGIMITSSRLEPAKHARPIDWIVAGSVTAVMPANINAESPMVWRFAGRSEKFMFPHA